MVVGLGGPFVGRALALLFVGVFLLSPFQILPADAEEPTETGGVDSTSAEPAAQTPRSIGSYVRDGVTRDLADEYARPTPNGLHIRAPVRAESMRIDPNYLEEEMGPWSAKNRFTLGVDGFVEFNKRTATFERLTLGTERVFTKGSENTVLFAERPMWVKAQRHGQEVTLDMDDGNAAGQEVFVAKGFLHEYGIHRPYARHEDGSSLTVRRADDGSGFWVEVPHFSAVSLGPDKIKVYGYYEGGIPVTYQDQVTWDSVTDEMFITVTKKLLTYNVLVEKDWFEAHMANVSLKDHGWTTTSYEGAPYYKVSLTSAQTPTTLHWMDFRITSNRLYTYGGPAIFSMTPVDPLRGPAWVRSYVHDKFIDLDIDITGSNAYDLTISGDWLERILPEHAVFSDTTGLLRPAARVNGNVQIPIVGSTDIRIWDSTAGPLVPPRYETIDGGIVKHTDGCRILHTVLSNNSSIEFEGPACVDPNDLEELMTMTSQAYWLPGASVVTACALFVDRSAGGNGSIAGSCKVTPPIAGELPDYVAGLCAESLWNNKSHEAFCSAGVSRYEAAGLPLGIENQTIRQLVSDMLHFNDPLMEALNEAAANQTLQAENAWKDEIDSMFRAVRLDGPCLNQTAAIVLSRWMPDSACGRSLTSYMVNNSTTVVNATLMWQAWKTLRDTAPCVQGQDAVVIHDGGPTVMCGSLLPRLGNLTANLTARVDWQTVCPGQQGLLFVGDAGNATAGTACGTLLPYPANPTTAANWESVRTWAPCSAEMGFILDASGNPPQRLCGVPALGLQASFADVFAYVRDATGCGDDRSILFVTHNSTIPVTICAKVAVGASSGWSSAWQELQLSNPCGGETIIVNADHLADVRNAQLRYGAEGTPFYEWCGTEFVDPDRVVTEVIINGGLPECAGDPIDERIQPLTFTLVGSDTLSLLCLDQIGDPTAPDGQEWVSDVVGRSGIDNPCGDQVFSPSIALSDPVTICGVPIPDPTTLQPHLTVLQQTIDDAMAFLQPTLTQCGIEAPQIILANGAITGGEIPSGGAITPDDRFTICGMSAGDILRSAGADPNVDKEDITQVISDLAKAISAVNQCDDEESFYFEWAPDIGAGCLEPVGVALEQTQKRATDLASKHPCEGAPVLCNPNLNAPPPPGVGCVQSPCLTYSLNGNATDVQAGLPAVYENGTVLWLLGAPIVSVGEPGQCFAGPCLMASGFAGIFASFVRMPGGKTTSSLYDYEASVQDRQLIGDTPSFSLSLMGTLTPQGPTDVAVASIAGHILLSGQHLERFGSHEGEGFRAPLTTTAELSYQTSEFAGNMAAGAWVPGGGAGINQRAGIPDPTAFNLGWVLNGLEEPKDVEVVGEPGTHPARVVTVTWSAIIPRETAVGFTSSAGDYFGVTFDPIPRFVPDAKVTFVGSQVVGNGIDYVEVDWPTNDRMDHIRADALGVPVTISRPPAGFRWSLVTSTTTMSELNAKGFVSELHGYADSDFVGDLSEGNGNMGLNVEVGGVFVNVTGLRDDLHVHGAYVPEMGEHKAMIPFVRVNASNPTAPGAASTLADRMSFVKPGKVRINVDDLASVDVDTSRENNQYDIVFGQNGHLFANLTKKDNSHILLSINANCAHYQGTAYLEKATYTDEPWGFKGTLTRYRGNVTATISEARQGCAFGGSYIMQAQEGGLTKDVILLSDLSAVNLTFNIEKHKVLKWNTETDSWEDHSKGKRREFGGTAILDGAALTLDLAAFDPEMELVVDATGLHKAAVDITLNKGVSYKGTNIDDEKDVDIGWHIAESGSEFFLDFGLPGDADDAGLKLRARPEGPVDSVTFVPYGDLDFICDNDDFSLLRSGAVEERCWWLGVGTILWMRTLGP